MAEAHDSLHLLVDGHRIESADRETRPVLNPATGQEIGRLPIATKADLDDALGAAERAFPIWRATSAYDRAAILHEAARLLRERIPTVAAALTREQGKPFEEARIELLVSADILDWCAEEGRRTYGRLIPARTPGMRQTVQRVPIGPVAAFTPWNAPALMPARKIGEALAAGCSCIVKPAEEAPAAASAIVGALVDAGLPAGVLSMVFGDPAEISGTLISSPIIRKASFTGSTGVGRELGQLAGAHVKPITLELGGHAPVLVFEDCDLDRAVTQLATMKIRNAGQLCGSPTRILVHEAIADDFLALMSERLSAVRVGDGMDASTQMGPLANPRRVVAMERLIEDAVGRGADVRAGGKKGAGGGFFFPPTLLSGVPVESEIMNQEPFGPICAVSTFQSSEDAIAEANRLPFGLAAYAFTRSAATADLLSETLEAGVIGINTFAVTSPETPLGGVKDSGYGTEGGTEGVHSYTVARYVAHDTRH